MRLFGFTVDTGVLFSWVLLALIPMCHQAQRVLPSFLWQVCVGEVFPTGLSNLSKTLVMGYYDLFEEGVCKPLARQFNASGTNAEHVAQHDVNDRRLKELDYDVPAVVRSWWG